MLRPVPSYVLKHVPARHVTEEVLKHVLRQMPVKQVPKHVLKARCSDDLFTAHYRLAHAVPMTWPQCTTDWRKLFCWWCQSMWPGMCLNTCLSTSPRTGFLKASILICKTEHKL